MLAHQLPALPPVETFWDALHGFLAWLQGGTSPETPAAYDGGADEELIRVRTLRLPVSDSARSSLEVIRFAASNHLIVELDYQGSTRRIEPYSLRRTLEYNIILHAYNIDKGEHRAYRVDRIRGARVTAEMFSPRFAIELNPKSPYSIPPTTAGGVSRRVGRSGGLRRKYTGRSRRTAPAFGPRYVYKCSYCGKRFYRKTRTARLNPHKNKNGYPCAGRHAHWIDTRY